MVDREAAARRQATQIQVECEQALAKVYGKGNPEEVARAPVVAEDFGRTWQAIAREMTARATWLEVGRTAFHRFQTRQPHLRLSLSTVARLLSVANAFGRLATGLDPTQPKDFLAEEGPTDFHAALQRIYGESKVTGPKI